MMTFLTILRAAFICSGLIFASLAFSYNLKVDSLLFSRQHGQWFVQADNTKPLNALARAVGPDPAPVIFTSTSMIIPFQNTDNSGHFVAIEFWVNQNLLVAGVGSNINADELAQHMDSHPNVPSPGPSDGFPAFSPLNALTAAALGDANTLAQGLNVAGSLRSIPATLILGGTQSPVGGGHAVSLTGEGNELTLNHHTGYDDYVPYHLPTVTVSGLTSAQLEQRKMSLTIVDDDGEQDESRGGTWQRFTGCLSSTCLGRWLGLSESYSPTSPQPGEGNQQGPINLLIRAQLARIFHKLP